MFFSIKAAVLALIAASSITSAFPGYDHHPVCITKYVTKVKDVYVPYTSAKTTVTYKPVTYTTVVHKPVTKVKTDVDYVKTTVIKTITVTTKVPVTKVKTKVKTEEVPVTTITKKPHTSVIYETGKTLSHKTKTKTVTKCDKHKNKDDKKGWKDDKGHECNNKDDCKDD